MDNILIAVFEDEERAHTGLRALHELHAEGNVTVYAQAVIAKDSAGNVTRTTPPQDGPAAAFVGLLTGTLVGLLGGPAGTAVGAGAGTALGAAFDARKASFEAAFFDLVASHLTPGKAALVQGLAYEVIGPGRVHA